MIKLPKHASKEQLETWEEKWEKKQYEKWYDNFIFTAIWSITNLVLLSLLIVVCIQVFGVQKNEAITMSSRSVMQANTFNATTQVQQSEEIVIKLVSNTDTDRQFEKIKTHLFEIVDTTTGKVIKLSKATIPFEYIENTINDYLLTSKYKTLAVGIVDNKFYIQQDTSVAEEDQLKTKIISMMDEFTADSWFKLTEAVFSSSDVQASSLFTYQTDNGNKHLIYIFKDR